MLGQAPGGACPRKKEVRFLVRFLTRFLVRFLTRFLARVLTRVSGRGKTTNTGAVLPGVRKTIQKLQKTSTNPNP